MSNHDDYYTILGVSKMASPEEIQQAYRKLAWELHPDRNPSSAAGEKMRKANEAYETLGDSKKRQEYNQKGFGANQDESSRSSSHTSYQKNQKKRKFKLAPLMVYDFTRVSFLVLFGISSVFFIFYTIGFSTLQTVKEKPPIVIYELPSQIIPIPVTELAPRVQVVTQIATFTSRDIILTRICPRSPIPRLFVGADGYVIPKEAPINLNRHPRTSGNNNTVVDILRAGDVFSVIGGPVCGNNYTWWQVRLYENQFIGWLAEGAYDTYWVAPR